MEKTKLRDSKIMVWFIAHHILPYSIFKIFLLHLLNIFQLFHLHIVFHLFSLFPISFPTSSSSSNFPPSCNFFQLLYNHVFQSTKLKWNLIIYVQVFAFNNIDVYHLPLKIFPINFSIKKILSFILCMFDDSCVIEHELVLNNINVVTLLFINN